MRFPMNVLLCLTLSAAVGLLGPAGCSSGSRTDAPQMYAGFGGYQRPITTSSPEAQQWFNQGLQLLYGFNHDEAIRSFRAAAAADPQCAMAWWGVAYANGLHINNPTMSPEQSKDAFDAAQEALARIDHAAPIEQALIRAVAERYAWPIPEDRMPLDEAYAAAMEAAWRAFPNDPDVGALYAESLMDLQPWDLWTPEGEPKGRALEIVQVLEQVMAMRPDHPGANHFYIHTVEASHQPERALVSAERLPNLVPGSGHLVHMPAHVYARVGRYDRASDANVQAIKADRAYFAKAPPPRFYSLYFVHNLHFLAYSAMMEGRYEVAIDAARDLEREIPENFLREWTFIADGFMPVTYHVKIRFGRWNDILREPEPPAYRHFSRTMHHYARGVALSALGRTEDAARELTAFENEAAAIPEDWMVGNNTAGDIVAVARQMLKGELAYREGNYDEAFAILREGVSLEDKLKYDEPPGWMQPVRHALGALLMGAGRAAEAEMYYRDDLHRNPRNGWAILGLEKSLRAQGKVKEAEESGRELAQVWTRADVKPTSSCYCQP